ncbi:MAG: nucleoside kinase [Bacteroidales bacterium]|nr:nucleoside kinase [Bacteroidales bacterium]MBP5758975.1 nucleoside kinase [Bacteroidales bacterium]
MQNVEVIIENTHETISVPCGTPLLDIAKDYQHTLQYPIIGALVNNEMADLNYCIYTPRTVQFFDISDKTAGYRVYIHSLAFMLYKAVRDIYPKAQLDVMQSLTNGYYCTITGVDASQIDIAANVRKRMMELVEADLPFTSVPINMAKAQEIIDATSNEETSKLLASVQQLYTTIQRIGDTPHKINCKLVPSTSYLKLWDFRIFSEGYLLQFPNFYNPSLLSLYKETPRMFNIFKEHHDWRKLLHISFVNDLNKAVREGRAVDVIHVSEALHEKKYATIADAIYQREGVKIVLIAGPSSSGKTTSCRRLGVQLQVLGYDVQQMSLDDYFVDRENTPRQPNGDFDFEALEALNIPLLNEHLLQLSDGKEVEIPTYNFIKGKSEFLGKKLRLGKNSILIMEGIHALNPKLTDQVPDEFKFKVAVSPFTQISIDNQNLIHTSDNRLIRRIVRDYNFRGYSAYETLKRWDSVRDGERKHIFPYQENADIFFNSGLLYELGVLKTYAEPLLERVPQDKPEHAEAHRLMNFLALFEPISPKHIPPTSIMREFLGDSSFEY